MKIDGERTLERLIAEEQKNSTQEGGLDKIAAEDEVVADASQKRMGDRAFWEAVIEAAGQENRSSIQRAFDRLKEWFGKIREAVTGFDKYTDAARILDKAERSVQDSLGQLFAEGMSEAVRTHDLVGDIKNTAREGGVKYYLRDYSTQQKKNWEGGRIVVYSGETKQIAQFIADAQAGKLNGKKLYFGAVDSTLAEEIKKRTGLDVLNYNLSLSAYEVQKIFKDHAGEAEQKRGQKPLDPSDFELIPFVVQNADVIQKSKKDYMGKPVIEFYSNIDAKRRMNVTVVVSSKHLDIFVQTMFIKEKSGNFSTPTDEQASVNTPKASSGTVSTTTSITQPAQNGNTQNHNKSSDPHMERSYEQGADLELMAEAAESLSEAGGEEYWAALLESAPELKEDQSQLRGLMKDYRAQAKRLAETKTKLAEARRQLTTTNRKLNTRGIAGLSQSIMKELGAGDAKNRGVAKQLTQILTDAYQKGLDAIDRGEDAPKVWDVVYYEGIEKAADYLLENATHSEKFSYSWTTSKLGQYMTGEEGRWAAIDAVSAKVVMDWGENRMRAAVQETAADRITERVEKRMQKQVDAATARATEAEQANEKLQRDLDFWKSAQEKAADQVSFLDERLRDARADLATNKRASAQQQKANAAKIRSMDAQIKAKRQEVQAWKQLASRNEALLRAALKSKNADLAALQIQMDRQASEARTPPISGAPSFRRTALMTAYILPLPAQSL